MFQLLPCSICQRTFSLRQDLSEDAQLKCPNCGNQFRLGDVLDAFYSPWIVLGDQGGSGASSDSRSASNLLGAGTAASSPTDSVLSFDNLLNTHQEGTESARSNAVTDDPSEVNADSVFNSPDLPIGDSSTLEVADSSAEAALDLELDEPLVSDDEPLAIEAERYSSPISDTLPATPAVKKPRVRKSDGGGLWSVIQVILGGAAAIPVTLLLLWYVVGKDVMDAGPTVARYAPWIVPKKFRSPPEFIVQRPDTPRVPPPALGEGGFRDFNQELGLNEPKSASDAPAAPQNEVTAATFDAQPVSAEPKPAVDNSPMAQVFATSTKAQKAIADWRDDSPEKTAQALELFNTVVELATLLGQLPDEERNSRLLSDKLANIGQSIAKNQKLRSEFFRGIPGQFGSAASSSTGRVFFGKVTEVKDEGDYWLISAGASELKVVIQAPKSSVPIIENGSLIYCLGQAQPVGESDSASSPKMESLFLKQCRSNVCQKLVTEKTVGAR